MFLLFFFSFNKNNNFLNRPGVAEAGLQRALSLIHPFPPDL